MSFIIRKANRSDVPHIVRLLADDNIGTTREKYEEPLPQGYYKAFDIINADKNNWLLVAELDNKIIGTLQITFITYLTYQGGKRAQIEGVRTDKSVRGKGIGKTLVEWSIENRFIIHNLHLA
jgi:N-acetylglutamate synthase-like GNAT family acetyltransferase